mgnify:CR=1 FL=1
MSSKRRNSKKLIMEQKKANRTQAEVPQAENTPVQETPSQPKERTIEKKLFLQYNGLEFSDKVMYEAAINDYCKKAGVVTEAVESVNLYVKPEEGKAYYVINQDPEKTGAIDL